MIKVNEGVRVCSDECPHSYELADKAKSIAYHFRVSVQDVLQELMYLELVNRKKTLDNIKGYLISSLYKNVHKRVWIDSNHAKRDKEMFGNLFLTFDKEKMRSRLFTEEFIALLQGVNKVLAEMVLTMRENVDDSMFTIYNCFYADAISSHEFYQRLKKIRKLAKQYEKEGFYLDRQGNLNQFMVGA